MTRLTSDVHREEDPRVGASVTCGITRVIGSTEFICIRAPHDSEHQRSSRRSAYGYVPQARRHHMVNRWPNRG